MPKLARLRSSKGLAFSALIVVTICIWAIFKVPEWISQLAFLSTATSSTTDRDLLGPLATLIAAFAGSWAAFRLQDKKERKIKMEADLERGLAAFSSLHQMMELMMTYRESAINPYRADRYRYILIGPTTIGETTKHLSAEMSLAYLMPHDLALVTDIFRVVRGCEATISTINRRARTWKEDLKPLIAPFEDTRDGLTDAVVDKLPKALTKELVQITDGIVQSVDGDIDRLLDAANKLGQLIMKQAKQDRPLALQMIDRAGNSHGDQSGPSS